MRRPNPYLFLALMLSSTITCTKPFNPPEIAETDSYLVVEGFANPGPDSTFITLSRSRRLGDTGTFVQESRARVVIQSRQGIEFPLTEISPGRYGGSLNLNPSEQYRLKVSTAAQSVYESAYEPVMITPPIDSLTWKYDGDVTIYVNASPLQDQPGFFRWDFEETWQYTSFYDSFYDWENGQINILDSAHQRTNCWDSSRSTKILTGATEALTVNVIREFPIQVVPYRDQKMGVDYSILVRQYGLTRKAYDFWQEIKKNGTQVGGLFDPLPTQLFGNIICVNNPKEIVIGYFNIGTVTTKRIFISNTELFNWVISRPTGFCEAKFIQNADSLVYFLSNPAYDIAFINSSPGLPAGIAIAPIECIDCKMAGGTTKKPGYWR
jgi:hypothetical protein